MGKCREGCDFEGTPEEVEEHRNSIIRAAHWTDRESVAVARLHGFMAAEPCEECGNMISIGRDEICSDHTWACSLHPSNVVRPPGVHFVEGGLGVDGKIHQKIDGVEQQPRSCELGSKRPVGSPRGVEAVSEHREHREPIKDPIEQLTGRAVYEEFWKQEDHPDWDQLDRAAQERWILLAQVAILSHSKRMREEGRRYGPHFERLWTEYEHRSHVTHILVHSPDPADMEQHYRWWCECGDVSLTDYPDQDSAAEAAEIHR